jgi:hypothetical protein
MGVHDVLKSTFTSIVKGVGFRTKKTAIGKEMEGLLKPLQEPIIECAWSSCRFSFWHERLFLAKRFTDSSVLGGKLENSMLQPH